MTATSVRLTFHLGYEDRPLMHRLYVDDQGRVQASIDDGNEGSFCLYDDPADVLSHLDALRRVVIDHLVETVGIPADPTTGLLVDVLREVGADLPSPLAHRIRSTIAGDQPETTGRTTAAALAERVAPGHDDNCPGPGDCFCIVSEPLPACSADPDGQHFVGCGCGLEAARLTAVPAGGVS